MPPKNENLSLLVVAHPDDETIFFGGLLQTGGPWLVVCVTDGNADGLGPEREWQFQQACKILKVKKTEFLRLPDRFEDNLDSGVLEEKLKEILKKFGKFKKVFTHSIIGEYGHKHHQDVSYSVHRVFGSQVFSVAYNCFPKLKITLNKTQYEKKTRLLWTIYSGETKRLINFLPATACETFVQVDVEEVEAIYNFINGDGPLNKRAVKVYEWLIPYLEAGGATLQSRPF